MPDELVVKPDPVTTVADPNAEPEKFEISTQTGQTFTGDSWEDVAKRAAESVEAGSRHITGLKRDLLTSELGTTLPKATTQATSPDKFDVERFNELRENDPIAAQNMIDAHRFGVKPEEVGQLMGTMSDRISSSEMKWEVATFMGNHPKWVGTEEDSAKLIKIITDNNWKISSRSLEVAYDHAIATGVLKATTEGSKEGEDGANKGLDKQPPPNLKSSGRGATTSMASSEVVYRQQLEGMTDEQVDAEVKRLQEVKAKENRTGM